MAWTFYNASGEALTSFGPVALTDLDIDGGTAIGEAVVGADLFIMDNGAGGTNVKVTATEVATFIGAAALTGTTANALVTITGANALTEETALTYDGANAFALTRDTGGNADLEFLVSNTDTDATAADAGVRVNVGGTGGGDPVMAFRISGGGEWEMGNDNGSSDIFVIGQGSGALGGNDALRITHATPPVVSLNAALGTTFDYVCETCGKSSYERFECCGAVYWQDDILSIRSAVVDLMAMKNPYEVGMSLNVDYMVKIGVLEYDTSEDDAMHNRTTPWLGLNLVQAQYFTWAGMFQNRERMDAQYAELKAENNELRALVGASDAR